MAFGPEDEIDDDTTLELTEDMVVDEAGEDDAGVVAEDEFPDTFDDAPSDETEEKPFVKHLRETHKEQARRIKQLEEELARNKPKPQRMEEPSLEGCEWDDARFKDEWRKWNENERAVDAYERSETEQRSTQVNAWTQERAAYQGAAVALGKPDYKAAEDAVCNDFSEVAQVVLVQAASSPEAAARIIYALGRSPAKRAELVALQDNPLKLAAAVARLEATSKGVSMRKEPPAIDTPLRGNKPVSSNLDKEEQRLEKEADRTGNRSALIAYRARNRAA